MREEVYALLGRVATQTLSVNEAMELMDDQMEALWGEDEVLDSNAENGFPSKWSDQINAKKTWIHSRNHLRRAVRAKYKGKNEMQ